MPVPCYFLIVHFSSCRNLAAAIQSVQAPLGVVLSDFKSFNNNGVIGNNGAGSSKSHFILSTKQIA